MPLRLDTPQLQQTRINSPEVSVDAATAPLRSMMKVAQQVENTSDAYHDYKLQLARVENEAKLSEARRNMAEGHAALQLDLQADFDPTSRDEKTNSFLESAKQYIPENSPPDLRRAFDETYSEFASKIRIQSAEDNAKITIKRASIAFKDEIDSAMKTGNRAQYEAAKAAAAKTLPLLPEELKSLDMDFDRRSDFISVETHILDDPASAKALIESDEFAKTYPHLDDVDRKKFLKSAETQIQRLRTEELDILENSLQSGDLRPSDIEQAVYLNDADRKALQYSLKKSTPPDSETITKAWEIVDQLRKSRDDQSISNEEYQAKHNDTRTSLLSMLPKSHSADVTQELRELSPSRRSSATSAPPTQSELKAAIRDQTKRALEAGLLGDISKKAPFEEKERAHRKLDQVRSAASQFLRSNPNATLEQIHKHTESLLINSLDDDTPLLDENPSPVSFDEEEINSLLMPLLPGEGANINPGTQGLDASLLPPLEK